MGVRVRVRVMVRVKVKVRVRVRVRRSEAWKKPVVLDSPNDALLSFCG
jgi:hypothetical protein